MSARWTKSRWECPRCGGDGFLLDDNGEATPCGCRATQVRHARSAGISSVIPRKYRGVSFERAPVPEIERTAPDVVREVRSFSSRIEQRLAEGRGIWFTGDTGTGKTTLAMLVSKAALDVGRSVAIYSIPHLLAEIRDTYGRDSGERSYMEFFNRLAWVDLLHLEDLGAERQTEWVLEQLYSLVNERYEQQRSVLITTNLNEPELEQQIGPRTLSRLVEMCGEPLRLHGEDRRVVWNPADAAA
jgi:DNA replication protein DnaC